MSKQSPLDYDSNPGRFRATVKATRKYGLVADVHEAVAQRLAGDAPGLVLDMGCGEGRFIAPAINEGLTVIALDYSVTMLRSIKTPSLRADAAHLPFADNTFSGVVALYMLYHLADPLLAIAEACRVLQPGGLFAACAPSRTNDPELAAVLPYWGLAETFDAENGPEQVNRIFGQVEEAKWDAPLIHLPDEAALRLYLRGRSLPTSAIDLAIQQYNTPLTLTKRGSLIYGRKQAGANGKSPHSPTRSI